jgi:hypothetical protein
MWYHRLDLGSLSLPCPFVYLLFSGGSSSDNCGHGCRFGVSSSIMYHCLMSLDMIICYYLFRQSLHALIMIWLFPSDEVREYHSYQCLSMHSYFSFHWFFFLRTAYRMKLEIIVSDKFKNCMKSQVIKNINKLECTMSRLHCKVTNMNNFTLTNALRNNTGGRTHRKWSHFNW